MPATPCPDPCPIQTAIALIQGKWTPQILRALSAGTLRFGQLQRALPGVSAKVLSQRLRELEGEGLIARTVLPCTPPAVEYQLSASGGELVTLLLGLYDFGARQLHTQAAA
jgi:DNA-binding HxlR family transcriptional regulator